MPAWKVVRECALRFCIPSSKKSQRQHHQHSRQHQSSSLPDLTMAGTKSTLRKPLPLPRPEDWIEDFADLSDVEAITQFAKQFRPELDRLKNASSTIETSEKSTIGADSDGLTPSQRIYDGEDYPEVNRTCLSMLCLKWLIKRDYAAFTANQPPVVKMTESSFDILCDLVNKDVLSKNGPFALTALLVAVVIGDIGKDPTLEKEVIDKLTEKGEDISDFNHDEIVFRAALLDMLEPLKLLRNDYREDVILGLKIGSNINVPQLAQAENVPGSLKFIESLKGNQQAFLLKYVEVILDVSGAGGHVDSRSAVRMIEPVFQSFASCRSALENIISGSKNLRQGYDQVLQRRGKLLDSKGVKSLRAEIPSERALLRLMCMGRVDSAPNAELMIAAFDGLRNTTRQHLIDGLSVDGIDDGEAILLYYIPGIFAEAFKITRDCPPPKKVEALKSVMRFMTRVYNGSKPHPGEPGQIIERNVGFAAKVIADEKFKNNPQVLDNLPLPWL